MTLTLGILFVVISAFIEGGAHTAFKLAVHHEGKRYALWMTAGIVAFLFSMAFYTGALKALDVVVAYPLDALNFAFVALFARYCLKEEISRRRWMGILLIAMGAALAIPQ
jgi:uncharacterized membrane protein